MPRLLKLEPARVGAVATAVYAAAAMLYRAYIAHDAVLDLDVLLAGLAGLGSLYLRRQVTPLARPRDHDGTPLVRGPTPLDRG